MGLSCSKIEVKSDEEIDKIKITEEQKREIFKKYKEIEEKNLEGKEYKISEEDEKMIYENIKKKNNENKEKYDTIIVSPV